jgi:hypothetical protein
MTSKVPFGQGRFRADAWKLALVDQATKFVEEKFIGEKCVGKK